MKWEWHFPIPPMVIAGARIHYLHKASVVLRHAQHVVSWSCSEDVGSNFLSLSVFFLYLELVGTRHNFVFCGRALNGLAVPGKGRELTGIFNCCAAYGDVNGPAYSIQAHLAGHGPT